MQKPILPKGTRDFNSDELYKRNYIINTIKENFSKFGFNPIETPSFERSETLLGKYGQDGERLIFKILRSGDFLKGIDVKELNSRSLAPKIIDKAPSGKVYLDGNINVDSDSQSIKDRKNLSSNGYLEVTILITPKGNIHNSPIASFKGLPIYEKEEFIYGLEDEIEKTARSFRVGSKQQDHNFIDALKITCRKFTKEKTGKKPFTNINLVRI